LIPPEVIPFIWFTGIIISVYVFFHKFSDVIKEKIRSNHKKSVQGNEKNIDQQVNSMINNAPELLTKVSQEIESQRANGVTDEQMKGLIQKQGMLKTLTENKEIIELIGKPILSKVLGWVKHL